MGAQAIRAAIADASIDVELVDQAVAAFAYAESGAGQRIFAGAGVTGIPMLNINNRCASGGEVFHLAYRMVLSELSECVVIAGFDEFPAMPDGSVFPQLAAPLEHYRCSVAKISGGAMGCGAAPFHHDLSLALLNYLRKERQIPEAVFARIAVKARNHARQNGQALLKNPLGLTDFLIEAGSGKPMPAAYSTFPASGAAAVVLCSARFAARYRVRRDVGVLSSAMGTPSGEDLESCELLDVLGRSLSRRTAESAYEYAGLGPEDLDLVELHDQCVASEAISCAALGLCA